MRHGQDSHESPMRQSQKQGPETQRHGTRKWNPGPKAATLPMEAHYFTPPPAILTEFPTSVKSETIIFAIMNKTSA